MKVIQITTVANTGSVARIAQGIGDVLVRSNHDSVIAASKNARQSSSVAIRIGDRGDSWAHGVMTRLFDQHGLGSRAATRRFVEILNGLRPDVIHLHNIHGYYINIPILFQYLKQSGTPVVWTMHDCWAFTGHCTYFDRVNCYKWETECHHCPNLRGYPRSWGVDNSRGNFVTKREFFSNLPHCHLVVPSGWMLDNVAKSFLSSYPIHLIRNGVDLNLFSPNRELSQGFPAAIPKGTPYLLGVASVWDSRKGLNDLKALAKILDKTLPIVVLGLDRKQICALPPGVVGLSKTENVSELAAFYANATAFVNPTTIDNFPTTNIEALACGCPVITYRTGGSPEAIDNTTGIVVEKGDIRGLSAAVMRILAEDKTVLTLNCRNRAERLFSSTDRYRDYMSLYGSVIAKGQIEK